MEETSEELPNFSIGIDLLGPDPTSSKIKQNFKKTRKLRAVRKFVEDQLQQSLAERHSLGTEQTCTRTGHQQHLKAKFPFLLLFLNLLCTLLSPDNPTEAGKFLSTNYTRRHKFITHKNNCCQLFSRSRNDRPMFVNEYEFFKEG